ncbi:hypothetical protein [Methylotenera sp. G11]|uniref:hypothetical protein n=1 Tax=Methylotenera sp. G11 TaxID=1506585 RepID=UPI0006465481|nr:hypothetical protein [Methylotenera sp. G11]
MKLIHAAMATLVFITLLLLIYYVHIRYFSVDVVFYAAIADALLAALLAGVILFTASGFQRFNHFEKTQLVIIWLLAGYAFAISVPTVIDRSLSFYILEKLQQRGGGIRLDSFEQVFTKEYVKEHRLVDVRLTEQLASGTIRIEHGCVTLTEKGKKIASFSRAFRQNLLPKQRLLMGQYTDDLTNPFKNSVPETDYACR